jgi:hypothetical protein
MMNIVKIFVAKNLRVMVNMKKHKTEMEACQEIKIPKGRRSRRCLRKSYSVPIFQRIPIMPLPTPFIWPKPIVPNC